jgi:GTPase
LPRADMFESLRTICYLASKIRTDVLVLRVSEGIRGLIVELMIRQAQKQGIKLEIRLLLLGDSGSGKSTLLGVLKSN